MRVTLPQSGIVGFIAVLLLSLINTAILIIPAFVMPADLGHKYLEILFMPLTALGTDTEFMRKLTIWLFGRMTPNYAPAQILLYFAFWWPTIFVVFWISREFVRRDRGT